MRCTWTREGAEWAVRVEDSPYAGGTAEGFPVTVRNRSGTKAQVVLGPLVRTFRVKGGRFVDVYAVDASETARHYGRGTA